MAGNSQGNVIKAVTCEINLGEFVLDAYMLPSGEKRIGVENTGVVLGYSERFFFQRTKRQSKALKTMQSMGFSGEQVWVGIIRQGEDNEPIPLTLATRCRMWQGAGKHQNILLRSLSH